MYDYFTRYINDLKNTCLDSVIINMSAEKKSEKKRRVVMHDSIDVGM